MGHVHPPLLRGPCAPCSLSRVQFVSSTIQFTLHEFFSSLLLCMNHFLVTWPCITFCCIPRPVTFLVIRLLQLFLCVSIISHQESQNFSASIPNLTPLKDNLQGQTTIKSNLKKLASRSRKMQTMSRTFCIKKRNASRVSIQVLNGPGSSNIWRLGPPAMCSQS